MRNILPLLLAGLALAACDAQRVEKLEEGYSTEADVRRQFGEPVQITEHADGSKRLEYPRQPEGWTNYVIEIGADGKMSALRQLLTPANFAKVQPGMAEDDVRRLLGRPAKVWRFPTKPDEETWDWRFEEAQTKKVFSVTFDREHRVSATGTADDPRTMDSGR
jgi:outer membrane protein assembly factor BamE (lipoprotein component of BamABCDE complex)